MEPAGLISIVSPCFNEEEGIEAFYRELKRVLTEAVDLEHEIILVDDGSQDGTFARLLELEAQDPQLVVLSLSRNFGHQAALTAGLEVARGDAVVMLDADLQHPPALIPTLVERWRAGFEVVSAIRERTAGASIFKRASSSLFYSLLNRLSETRIEPGCADFCLLSRRAHQALLSLPERHRFTRGLVAWVGFKRAFVPFTAAARHAGSSKYGVRKMLVLALDAVFSFSISPIRAGIRLGLLITFAGSLYLAYILGRFFFLGDLVPGWGSLISVVLILGGVQLAFIGLIGEYVGRIFEQTKARPIYLLRYRTGDPRPGEAAPAQVAASTTTDPTP